MKIDTFLRLLFISLFINTSLLVLHAQELSIDWSDEQAYSVAHKSGIRIIGHTESHYYLLTKGLQFSQVRFLKYSNQHELIEDEPLTKIFDRGGIMYQHTIQTSTGSYWIFADDGSLGNNDCHHYAVQFDGATYGPATEISSFSPESGFSADLPSSFHHGFADQLGDESFVVSADGTYVAAFTAYTKKLSNDRIVIVSLFDADLQLLWQNEYKIEEEKQFYVKQISVSNQGEVALLTSIKNTEGEKFSGDYLYHYQFITENTAELEKLDISPGSSLHADQACLQVVENENSTQLAIIGFYRENKRRTFAQAGVFFQLVSFSGELPSIQKLHPYQGTGFGRSMANPYEYSAGYHRNDIDTYVYTEIRRVGRSPNNHITLIGEHSYAAGVERVTTPQGHVSSGRVGTLTLSQVSLTDDGEIVGATTFKRPYGNYWGGSISFLAAPWGQQTLLLYQRFNRGAEKKALKQRGFKGPSITANYALRAETGEITVQDVLFSYGDHGALYPVESFVSEHGILLLSRDYGYFKVGHLKADQH